MCIITPDGQHYAISAPESSREGKETIIIHIDTKDALASVDEFSWNYYFECLYNNSVEEAKKHNIPLNNLMDTNHIAWEFNLHAIAYYLGFDAAITTDLNIDETLWTMIKRAIG